MNDDQKLLAVNAYRMQQAREMAGLTVRQVATLWGLDVRPGEYFGQMPADDLDLVHELYEVRPRWLEEEGPTNDPDEPWAIVEAVYPTGGQMRGPDAAT